MLNLCFSSEENQNTLCARFPVCRFMNSHLVALLFHNVFPSLKQNNFTLILKSLRLFDRCTRNTLADFMIKGYFDAWDRLSGSVLPTTNLCLYTILSTAISHPSTSSVIRLTFLVRRRTGTVLLTA